MKRGQDGQLGLAEAFMAPGLGVNARLEKIESLVNWSRFEQLLSRVRPGESGRPPYRALAIFKALLLQQWYGLSDPGLEEALGDRLSFRRFCGFALDEATPDEATICRFRQAVIAAGLRDRLLGRVERPARRPRPDAQARHDDRCHAGRRPSRAATPGRWRGRRQPARSRRQLDPAKRQVLLRLQGARCHGSRGHA